MPDETAGARPEYVFSTTLSASRGALEAIVAFGVLYALARSVTALGRLLRARISRH